MTQAGALTALRPGRYGRGTRMPPPPPLRLSRVSPERFLLPVDRLRDGYYSDAYFVRTREVLLGANHRPHVTMQVFQKHAAWLGGVDEAVAILKLALTGGHRWEDLEVHALRDGDRLAPRETVMSIRGPYAAFAHLETVYLGVLARRTRVATNTRLVVEAARPKPVMFFPARFDHWLVQTGDGYAAHVAGRSACRPTRRRPGGAPRASAPSRTR